MLTPDSPVVLLSQLAFYGGLLVLLVGLPVFIWLWIRALRDLHDIRESLHWIAHCTRAPEQPVQAAKPATSSHHGSVVNSAFGR